MLNSDCLRQTVFWPSCVLLITAGCEPSRPRNPAHDVISNPAATTENPWVTSQQILINGRDIEQERVMAEAGVPLTVSGAVEVDESHFEGEIMAGRGLTEIKVLPRGSSEEAWSECNREFQALQVFRSVLDGQRVKEIANQLPPGQYDLRVYQLIKGRYDDVPVYPLIAKGQLDIVARGEQAE